MCQAEIFIPTNVLLLLFSVTDLYRKHLILSYRFRHYLKPFFLLTQHFVQETGNTNHTVRSYSTVNQ